MKHFIKISTVVSVAAFVVALVFPNNAQAATDPGLGAAASLPDFQETHEIRPPVAEESVCLVRLRFLFQGTLPGILNAEGRGENDDLAERSLFLPFQQNSR